MLDAKCPRCNRIAEFRVESEYIICRCGYEASYDDYIKEMKERVFDIFNENIDRI